MKFEIAGEETTVSWQNDRTDDGLAIRLTTAGVPWISIRHFSGDPDKKADTDCACRDQYADSKQIG